MIIRQNTLSEVRDGWVKGFDADRLVMTGTITRWRSLSVGGLIDFVNDLGAQFTLSGMYVYWDSYEILEGKRVRVWLRKADAPEDVGSRWFQIVFVEPLEDLMPLLSEQEFRRIADILKEPLP